LTDEDKSFANFILQYDHGKLNIFWQSLMKGYDEIKISPHPHSTLEMILLRSAFLINDESSDGSEEKKKSKINPKQTNPSPNLDQAVQNKVEDEISMSLEEKINIHQDFFQFYGKNFSPLMAGIIIENCEIIKFSESEKRLIIHVLKENFSGSEELKTNLRDDFKVDIVVKKKIDNLDTIKKLYKKELIDIEMQTDDFKKVLAKFPNAKIIDIEELERGDENDG